MWRWAQEIEVIEYKFAKIYCSHGWEIVNCLVNFNVPNNMWILCFQGLCSKGTWANQVFFTINVIMSMILQIPWFFYIKECAPMSITRWNSFNGFFIWNQLQVITQTSNKWPEYYSSSRMSRMKEAFLSIFYYFYI